MNREEAAEILELLYGDCDPLEENTWLALRMGVAALRGPQPDTEPLDIVQTLRDAGELEEE